MNFLVWNRSGLQDHVSGLFPYTFWLSISIDYKKPSGIGLDMGIDRMFFLRRLKEAEGFVIPRVKTIRSTGGCCP